MIGRDAEQQRLTAALHRTLDGGSGGLITIAGPAGVGKTALVRWFTEQALAAGADVRVAVGTEAERSLPYGVLSWLLAADARGRAKLPKALSFVVSAAPTGGAPSTMAVATAVLDTWSKKGSRRPLVAIVDDAQWADASSRSVLHHVGRHAFADRVLVVLAHRAEAAMSPIGATPTPTHVHLDVGVLTPDHARTMLRTLGCPAAEIEHWVPRCGGLPLALAEVAARRRADTPVRGAPTISDFVPSLYRDTVAALDQHLDLLLDAALAPDTVQVEAIAAYAALADVLTVERDPSRGVAGVHFRHPLLQAAVLAAAGADRERAAHERAARHYSAVGDADRSALHAALATAAPNREVADQIGALGARAVARGALAEAAAAFLRAAELSHTAGDSAPWLTKAADAQFDHGDTALALRTIDEAVDRAATPADWADACTLRARMSTWAISPRTSVERLVAVADRVSDVEPVRAALALASSSTMGYLADGLRSARARGMEAERLATLSGDPVGATSATAALAWNAFMATDWDEFTRRAEPIEPIMRFLLDEATWAGVHLAELFGTAWVCAERWDEADPLVTTLLSTVKAMGTVLTTASTSYLLASLRWRQGRWAEADVLTQPFEPGDDVPRVTTAYSDLLRAQFLATTGRFAEMQSCVDRALPLAVEIDAPLLIATGRAALGHAELSSGRPQAAVGHFDQVAASMDRIGFEEPGYLPWHGDFLDALVHVGRHDEARAVADHLSTLAERGQRRWLRGIVARARASMATNPTTRVKEFATSLAAFRELGMPFEYARTLLARGGVGDLAEASRVFTALGADVWAARADPSQQVRREPAPHPLLARLTTQERNVALAVMSGRTNREIATELHLSEKTVDHYLQRVYQRLEVKNRTALTALLARQLDAPSVGR